MEQPYTPFRLARPVWPLGKELEMNLTVRLQGRFCLASGGTALLRITASTIYRAFLNGALVAYGPARCAHGVFRVDEWPLPPGKPGGENTLVIEAAGYNVNCYAYLDQPAFVQAELEAQSGGVLLFTGSNSSFTGGIDTTRVQKAQRYSFQRAFVEAYHLPQNPERATRPCEWAVQADKRLLPRRIPLPVFRTVAADAPAQCGKAETAEVPRPYPDKATTDIGPAIKGFAPGSLDAYLSRDAGMYRFLPATTSAAWGDGGVRLDAAEYALCDFGRNLTGFISLEVVCEEAATLYLMFDEKPDEAGGVDYLRLHCVNVLRYVLPAGTHALLSIEPYVMRCLNVFCAKGRVQLQPPGLVEYKANLPVQRRPVFTDPALSAVYDAAVQTLLQNSADIYMDCPSRERAGWLCDSFFTARAEKQITGQNLIEENFLENFLLPNSFEYLPKGMLPMCYPSDHNDGNFIPNWAMWLILELEDYLARGGRRQLIDAFLPKADALLDYFQAYLNEDGLLEDLDGWVFVDWSRANDADVVCGVNYPSNMLYARMLQAVAAMYNRPLLARQAARIHAAIREQSYNGVCFIDNRVRQNGVLTPGPATTEACQNYAFFCKTATPESHPALWADFLKKFDAAAGLNARYNLCPGNAFIALYVRLATLAAAGRTAEIQADVRGFFVPQAALTGTLWEKLDSNVSLNHGFAAYAANLLL